MTVIVSKSAINLREELASLRNQGGYEEQQFYFDNLVTNGGFDTSIAGWTSISPASIVWNSGAVNLSRNNGSAVENMFQTFSLTSGKTYHFSINIVALSNSVSLYSTSGGELIGTTSSTGVFTATKVWDDNDSGLYIGCGGSTTATATVDDITIFETGGTDLAYPMPKGWVPLHVYEDGLLQREGAAHDYEVVYDGFDYSVKPTVIPSPSSEICVIGVRK